jgi:LysM repeat protein
VWSSTDDDPAKSVNPAYPNLRVGIDPTGQWNPWAGSVIWSEAQAFYDTWGQLAVEAVAQNSTITVFLHSAPNWPVKHNDMYWDDAVLVAVSGSSNPPPPPTATTVPPTAPPPPGAPTNTPLPPANSPTPAPPTATCASPPEDWVIYVVQRGDTLYGLARARGTTLERVVSVNCLASTSLFVNQELYLPPMSGTPTPTLPTPTPTEAATETATLASTATTVPSATPAAATSTVSPPPTDTATPVAVAAATDTQPPSPVTPSPLATTTTAPTATLAEQATTGTNTWVYGAIVLAIGLIGAAAFFLRRQEK